MDAHDRTWLAWLAGLLATFGVLETRALIAREPGKPSGTLTSTMRRWLGVDPLRRRRWVCGATFVAFWAYLAAHFLSTRVGP